MRAFLQISKFLKKDQLSISGRLTLVFSDLRHYMNIEDDYEQEIEKFKNKFPEIKGEIVKNLMKLEKKR